MDRRLLVVDDEADFGDFVRQVAVDLGYDVRVCTQSPEFFRHYEALNPTHIVLDIVMPDLDGVEIVQWLVKQGCAAKIIITTGYNPKYAEMASMIATTRGSIPIKTLIKPVRLGDLRAALA
jgi:CheY-like chemotaxis protein